LANPDFTILLVEDDEIVAEMYRLALVASGRDVVVGRDGEEGLAMASDENPDFIVLDLRLPKLDGLEVLARLRRNDKTKDIPVIILSNVGDPRMLEGVSRLGVVEFMVKAHTTPAELSLRIAEHERRTLQPRD
jgi:DNA-binding response OmpR family regulator